MHSDSNVWCIHFSASCSCSLQFLFKLYLDIFYSLNVHILSQKYDCSNKYSNPIELTNIITGTSLEATPHMKLVWEQQKKALNQQSKNGHRWHPHFIRFSLSLYSKSPSVYRELRDSGTLQLPSARTLRSYKNSFQPGAGYLPDNIASLISRTKSFTDLERWVVVMFDEMKIKCNLV